MNSELAVAEVLARVRGGSGLSSFPVADHAGVAVEDVRRVVAGHAGVVADAEMARIEAWLVEMGTEQR